MNLSGGGNNVGSAEINDNAIVNDDVNSAAAIAGSKLQALTVGANAGVIPSTGIVDAHISATALISLSKLQADAPQLITVSLTANEIKALHTTPKQILAAPAAGKVNIIEYIVYSFTDGVNYTGGSPIYPIYGTNNNAVIPQLDNTLINGGANFVAYRNAGSSAGSTSFDATVGIATAINLRLENAVAFVTGDGTLKCFIKYRTITL